MKISERGIDLIKEFEGVRLNAYRDAVGVVTIGYGHTRTAKPGMQISAQTAEDLLRQDIARFEECVSNAVKVDLTQPQFDALVSFAFNVGCGALGRSTLLRLLNRGDYDGAAKQFGRWNMAGGRRLAGLTRRRAAEAALFQSAAPVIAEDAPTPRPTDPDLFDRLGVLDLRGTAHEDGARRIQRAVGAIVDGILGAETWSKLIELEPEE